MEVTLPFARTGADDDHPVLWLIAVCFFMAAILLIPACVEVAWRGGRAIRRFFSAWGTWRRRSLPWGRGDAWDDLLCAHHRPVCGEEAGTRDCEWPFCQHPLHDYHGLPLDEKLRLALSHPVLENRMLAAEWLGELGDPSALLAFRQRLVAESDPRVIAEIARAAARIGGEGAVTILAALRSHQSEMVREAVGRLLDEGGDEGWRREIAGDLTSRDDRLAGW